ncbi:transglutaminase/protease-like cytokinesis protein 3 [Paenibacillus endophyticus]|uniref:Transglutaminase/protease-like cytokinesis protein 3 n=1 Tax=Paenibacillus endophyticus TaxID=1294268 RepID=A0A7W5CEF8_9BACL|nr:transglutaminase-like domain-containing protein [Paenibacillus endophyticus]MBB3156112.1 transglutaminase/protease-like cytokinesis protein 3 [Paenibacillus endophyticus]
MRKFILLIAVFILFASINAKPAQASEANQWLNTTGLSNGVVAVEYPVKAKVKTKLMIAKGQANYTYNLTAGGKAEQFPLQLGNGQYTISVLENASANKYKLVAKQTVTLSLKDSKVLYLNSIQNINWTDTSNAIVKAKELTKNKKTDSEKVKAVYDYVITNINYDNQLAANLSVDYLPSIDRTFKSKKDICYGYAALFAGMLRSLDIPTKLMMGNSEYVDVYHAWNEVYLDGKWVIIDTTVDAGFKKGNKKFEQIKNASKYTVSKQY